MISTVVLIDDNYNVENKITTLMMKVTLAEAVLVEVTMIVKTR